jgi:hypothetical protein
MRLFGGAPRVEGRALLAEIGELVLEQIGLGRRTHRARAVQRRPQVEVPVA